MGRPGRSGTRGRRHRAGDSGRRRPAAETARAPLDRLNATVPHRQASNRHLDRGDRRTTPEGRSSRPSLTEGGDSQRILALVDDGQPLRGALDLDLEALRLHALLDGLAAHLLHDAGQLTPEQALAILDNHLTSLTKTRNAHPARSEEN
ncbi:TetR family transcriptional regulator C-terminal domain-containing protein [Luethyella okanaganae]|uniref:TetR family transcriptional regulator C-terminal domain-containing protein n=1 Tax=Luethyella okanaganae TaxID=69372 RepID=A0ABW1VGD8_9MICO